MLGEVISAYTSILTPKEPVTEHPTWFHLHLALWWLLNHDYEENWFAIEELYQVLKLNCFTINPELEAMYNERKQLVSKKEV